MLYGSPLKKGHGREGLGVPLRPAFKAFRPAPARNSDLSSKFPPKVILDALRGGIEHSLLSDRATYRAHDHHISIVALLGLDSEKNQTHNAITSAPRYKKRTPPSQSFFHEPHKPPVVKTPGIHSLQKGKWLPQDPILTTSQTPRSVQTPKKRNLLPSPTPQSKPL